MKLQRNAIRSQSSLINLNSFMLQLEALQNYKKCKLLQIV
jgi:hypothetical protein